MSENQNEKNPGVESAGIVYGNVSNASTIYGQEVFHARQGHGYAAEQAEHLVDILGGKDASLVGVDLAKNGADRLVNGTYIQTKYCETGVKCIDACFVDGQFRYVNADGTPTSKRTIDVPDKLMEKLKRHQRVCQMNRLRMGEDYTATDFIIVHPDGKPIYPEYLSQMLTKLQKKYDLPQCRFHDLRHLCASIMLMQGVNVKVAQERLGHKDISTTLNIYSHVLPSSAKEAAEKIGEMIYLNEAV